MVKRTLEEVQAAQAVAAHTGSARSAARLLTRVGPAAPSKDGDGAWTHSAKRELQKIAAQYQTTLKVDTESGAQLDFHVVKLPEVLSWFCETNPDFGQMLMKCLRGNEAASVYLYCDEVTPGAVLAPLNTRKSYLWYLAFDLFGYFLHHVASWTCVAIMTHDHVDVVRGGLSAAVRALVHHLFDSSTELVKIGEQTWLLKLCLHKLTGDADAMRAIFSSMGSGGVRPCVKCTNCIHKTGRVPPGYVTIAESNAALFKPMQDEVLWKIVDYLKSVAEMPRSKTLLDKAETTHGLHWDPAGLLADVTLRGTVRPSHGTGDSMHILYSNGVAALELGLFLDACWAEDITLGNVRAFAKLWEANNTVLQAIHDSKFTRATFKGSASECKSLIPLFSEFARSGVNKPSLTAYVTSMCALGDVCRELHLLKCKRDTAAPDVTRLARLLQLHLDAFKSAYGVEHVKPKHHQAQHLPQEIKEVKRVMDCWTAERRNKIWKLYVAPHCTPAGLEKHSLAKLLLMQRDAVREMQFKEQYMDQPTQSDNTALQYGWPEAYLAQSCWRKGQAFSVGDIFCEGDTAFEMVACVSDGTDIYILCHTYDLDPSLCFFVIFHFILYGAPSQFVQRLIWAALD